MDLLAVLAGVVIAAVWSAWRRYFSPNAKERRAKNAEASAALREHLLSGKILKPDGPNAPSEVSCVAAELGIDDQRFVTVAVYSDGTVSLYQSSGGAVLGAGSKPEVSRVAEEFRSAVVAHESKFTLAETWPPPSRHQVVAYIVTAAQTRSYVPMQGKGGEVALDNEIHRLVLGLVNFIYGFNVVPPRTEA